MTPHFLTSTPRLEGGSGSNSGAPALGTVQAQCSGGVAKTLPGVARISYASFIPFFRADWSTVKVGMSQGRWPGLWGPVGGLGAVSLEGLVWEVWTCSCSRD